VYNKGLDNKAADALSRRPNFQSDSHPLEIFAVSQATPVWLEQVVLGYGKDDQTKKLLTELSVGIKLKDFSLTNGVIRFKGKIWIGHNQELQTQILSSLHSSALRGHSGFPITYKRIKQLLHGPN
jgi:hypothetical protein